MVIKNNFGFAQQALKMHLLHIQIERVATHLWWKHLLSSRVCFQVHYWLQEIVRQGPTRVPFSCRASSWSCSPSLSSITPTTSRTTSSTKISFEVFSVWWNPNTNILFYVSLLLTKFHLLATTALPLKRITLGEHYCDNNIRMIHLTDIFCILFRDNGTNNRWL